MSVVKLPIIVDLSVHQVKPECMEDYLQQAGEQLVQVAEDSEIPVKLLGSWITIIGTQLDQASKERTHRPSSNLGFCSRLCLATLEIKCKTRFGMETLASRPLPHTHTHAHFRMHTHTPIFSTPSPSAHIWQYTGFDKVEETAAKLKNNKVSLSLPLHRTQSTALLCFIVAME